MPEFGRERQSGEEAMNASFSRREALQRAGFGAAATLLLGRRPAAAAPTAGAAPADARRPNIVLAMTDDQGWGDTGYNGHPRLKTPNLDAMAAAGLRFDRFHSASPVCSPTRGSVLTGRHPDRFGCFSHGYPLRLQELTLAQVLKDAGYATGHFGKWHLNGKAGPGVPVRADDPLNPGAFGFEEWCSVSNFFDLDGGFGRNGVPEGFTGDSSDAAMAEAIRFIRDSVTKGRPFFAVVWYGSPHGPHKALPEDKKDYAGQSGDQGDYFGELTAVDRTVGLLRATLRELGVAENTIFWFCSDNGGAAGEESVGGLRGRKGTLWEGGVRVPGLIEWPAAIPAPRTTALPATTMDIFPTIVDLLGLTPARRVEPLDGLSLAPLIRGPVETRAKPIPFSWREAKKGASNTDDPGAAIIDNDLKLLRIGSGNGATWELYDLAADPKETKDLADGRPADVARLRSALEDWLASVERSLEGKDYPEGRLTRPDPGRTRLTPDEQNWRGSPPAGPAS